MGLPVSDSEQTDDGMDEEERRREEEDEEEEGGRERGERGERQVTSRMVIQRVGCLPANTTSPA